MRAMADLNLEALLSDATEFCTILGVPTDEATKSLLDRYPLPLLFSVLEIGGHVSDLIASTLEKILKSSYVVHVLPQALPYAGAGLRADTSLTRRMTCLAILKLLEESDKDAAVQAILDNDLLHPLLSMLGDGDETVSTVAARTVESLAKCSIGQELLFLGKGDEAGQLKELVKYGSSLVKIRVLSIVATLFRNSQTVTAAIKHSGILDLLEAELDDTNDMLAHLNALELLYDIATTPDGAEFLMGGNLVERLISIIRSLSVDPIIRSRAIMVSARLISPDASSSSPVSQQDALRIIQVIDENMQIMRNSQSNEWEVAIDALGQVGMTSSAADLLFSSSPPAVRHIVDAAFFRGRKDVQLAGVQALASVAGSERTTPLLTEQAEACLRDLILSAVNKSSKHPFSDLLLSLLQDPDTRLAAYRLITALAARHWFLQELCSTKELINFLTDQLVESTKEGMEWRHASCVAISTSLSAANYRVDSSFSDIIEKLQEAVRRGPYPAKEHVEARPIVVTEERF